MKIEYVFDNNWDVGNFDFQVIQFEASRGVLEASVFNQDLSFHEVVDESERLDEPTLYVSNINQNVILFGGNQIYYIARGARFPPKITIGRDRGDLEYWKIQLIRWRNTLFFITEGKILAIDDCFKLLWSTRIFYDYTFLALHDDHLYFKDGDDERIKVDLETGSLQF